MDSEAQPGSIMPFHARCLGNFDPLSKSDYKFLSAMVMVCATQTERHTDRQHLISLYEQLSQVS